MKNNSKLQKDVQNAIKWEPSIHAAEIGVTAKDGIVTLSGTVDRYSKKINAERAAKKVVGVKSIKEDIIIDAGYAFIHDDAEIEENILEAWNHNWEIPADKLKISVEDGWVQLDGEVPWNYQQEAAIIAINHLSGVKGVTNLIKVKSTSQGVIETKDVEAAFKRNWALNSKEVKVDVNHNKVKLTGIVHSLYQKEEAGRLAWNAPGVASVDNELAILR